MNQKTEIKYECTSYWQRVAELHGDDIVYCSGNLHERGFFMLRSMPYTYFRYETIYGYTVPLEYAFADQNRNRNNA